MPEKPTLQTLLRLKRDEQPPPEFFESMLTDFHRRQRQELLKRSAFSLARERFEAFGRGMAAELQLLSHGWVTLRRLSVGGAFATLLAAALLLPLLQAPQEMSPSGSIATRSSASELKVPENFPFFSNEAIAAALREPLEPVRHSSLVFDADLSPAPGLTASASSAAPHYVVDYIPTGGDGRVSF